MTRFWLVAALAMFVIACDQPDKPCDPGQIYVAFLCMNPPPDAAPANPNPNADAGAVDGGNACEKYTGFGTACQADTDCPCGTVCNPIAKYCTRNKCLADPTICPPEPAYSCMDISMFDPAVGSTCFRH